ncbi:MAG: hypothetical protein E7100_02535 [Bacteroidaceae bacterium]|jgi:hypothetical protein|nr:hypothetical protein [Bacteroidaceae bacterium]
MEIGSIYSLDQCYSSSSDSNWDGKDDVTLFSLCREALYFIASLFEKTSKRVLLPAYTCQTVIDPFAELGWQIEYYNITSNLRIDTEDLIGKSETFAPAICLAHPFYGADLNQEELDVLLLIKQKKCVLVEDLTQCVFSNQRSEIFDFFVGSYRKWFPIPDGAFLVGKGFDNVELDENTIFVQYMSDAMYLRGLFHKTNDVNTKEISRRIGNVALSYISGQIVPHKMSSFSRKLLAEIDLTTVQKRRMSNYRYLYENFHHIKSCTPVERSMDEITCAPLFFPIYVEDRGTIQKQMAANEIYAPILWPVYSDSLLINQNIENIYNHILMIPCDQRYTQEDMERVLTFLKNS